MKVTDPRGHFGEGDVERQKRSAQVESEMGEKRVGENRGIEAGRVPGSGPGHQVGQALVEGLSLPG
ncbi:UNVERIFIED_CONTAM: hypothetical protein Slati_0970500 [Sesamum latifolium]|uniref:Uncharacterized protein n=1 Tax=Sesamum latifolium TaxID=2727402 RepID=A0AAW2XQ90_9LAMI